MQRLVRFLGLRDATGALNSYKGPLVLLDGRLLVAYLEKGYTYEYTLKSPNDLVWYVMLGGDKYHLRTCEIAFVDVPLEDYL